MQEKSIIIDNICHICGEPGYKTDGECKIWCKKCMGIAMSHTPYVRESKKLSRNDLCSCGSGLKYKKCCLNKNK